MKHQQTLAFEGGVNRFFADFDRPENMPDIVAERFVVVTGNVNHPSAAIGLAKQGAQHLVVTGRPVQRAGHGPEIDHVAHQINGVAFNVIQAVQQVLGAAILEAEVDIGKP